MSLICIHAWRSYSFLHDSRNDSARMLRLGVGVMESELDSVIIISSYHHWLSHSMVVHVRTQSLSGRSSKTKQILLTLSSGSSLSFSLPVWHWLVILPTDNYFWYETPPPHSSFWKKGSHPICQITEENKSFPSGTGSNVINHTT